MKVQALLFPLAAAINFFSVTALLIIAGLLGQVDLAADIAIIQGAVVAVFLSLSGNARNLILASSSDGEEKSLFYFRLMVMFPAVMAVFYLTKTAIDIPIHLIIGFILRKCSEWTVELQLANKEKNNDFIFAFRYIQINTIAFLSLVLMMIFSDTEYFYLTLYIWAIIPITFSLPYIRSIIALKKIRMSFAEFIPHIGSSSIIGISTYVFRVLIVILAGKALAGQMFTAYALGGVMSSLYTYAIGPTLMLRKKTDDQKVLFFVVCFCIFLGVMVILPTLFWDVNLYPPIFIHGIGYSLVGGGVMLLAQRQRLYILQVCKKEVFVPDALINILLIATVPFAYYLFGDISFAIFFLWSAVLNFLFYISLANKNSLGDT